MIWLGFRNLLDKFKLFTDPNFHVTLINLKIGNKNWKHPHPPDNLRIGFTVSALANAPHENSQQEASLCNYGDRAKNRALGMVCCRMRNRFARSLTFSIRTRADATRLEGGKEGECVHT